MDLPQTTSHFGLKPGDWAAVPADQADADVDAAEHAHAPHSRARHDAGRADSLRLCRSAGDKIPAELEKEVMALTGHPISEGYG
jgi:acyl-coenzyme A synthetase/AMP-(fatty) acid ligase